MVPLQKVDYRWPNVPRIADGSSMSETGDLYVLGVGNGLRNLAGASGTGVDVGFETDNQARDSHLRKEGKPVLIGGDEASRTSPSFGDRDASPVRLDRLHVLDEGVVSQSARGEGGQKPKRESETVQVVVADGQSLPRCLKDSVELVLTPIGGKQSRATDPVSREEGDLLRDCGALRPADEGDGFGATGDECINTGHRSAPVQLLGTVFEGRDPVAEGKQIRAHLSRP